MSGSGAIVGNGSHPVRHFRRLDNVLEGDGIANAAGRRRNFRNSR